VRHFYGLMTVKGRFDRYTGTIDLQGRPARNKLGAVATKIRNRGGLGGPAGL
jgi:hypothetical protein